MGNNQLITKNTSYFIRGIAMLMVVMSHYFEWGMESVSNVGLAHFMTKLGDPGVGIFFLLSGYALYKGYGDNNGRIFDKKKYLLSRFKGVYLPYLLIVGVINIISGGFDSPKAFIKFLYGGDFWFMTVIFIIYLGFFLVSLLPKWRIFIMTVFIIDLSLFYYVNGYAEFWYDANWCFAIGMILAKYDENFKIVKNGFSINIKDFLLVFIGKVSLYIYILHTFIYMRIINVQALSNINWGIKVVLSFIITAIVGFVIKTILESVYKLFK